MSEIGDYLCEAAQGRVSRAEWFKRVDMSAGHAYSALMNQCLRILLRRHDVSRLTAFDCALVFHVECALQRLDQLQTTTAVAISRAGQKEAP